jgi:hypothetical protein
MKLPEIVHNWLSYLGALIAGLALCAFIFLYVLATFTDTGHVPYAGLVIFILVPAILLIGLLIIPIGMFFEWRHWKRTATHSIETFPKIDLNQPGHRNAVLIFAAGFVVLLFLSAFGSYQAYEYTDSVAFCGTLCHQVMSPEYETYLRSPHARVRCAECHVGPGASWYVKSKLSGAYQVYSATFDKYPRPIPTPIQSLRPAQDTCEQCHWPSQFFGSRQKTLIHFSPDEANTRWEINLLIRIGGGRPESGRAEGIHWHTGSDTMVEYIATDQERQQIPWVRLTQKKTGIVTEYVSTQDPLPENAVQSSLIRRMDCMDCHNRPTHILQSPSAGMDKAMAAGSIDATLPLIKSKGVELLAAQYSSTEAAVTVIDKEIRQFYHQQYPELEKAKEAAISSAVTAISETYRTNFFPEMKVRWNVYPDNVGHRIFPGCFRCHDGQHQSRDGKTISNDCQQCHAILSQGEPAKMIYSSMPEGLPFKHPGDVGDSWVGSRCNDCHTGEAP